VKSTTAPRSINADRQSVEAATRLDVRYINPANLPFALAESDAHPMAVVSFGHTLPNPVPCPAIMLDLPQIDGPPLVEVWMSDQPATVRHTPTCSMAMTSDMLIGSIRLDEQSGISLDATTYAGYRDLLQQLRALGYPHLWRIWNYFPRINDEHDGLERYRRFCVGRYQALTESLSDFPSSLPAATAVGTQSGPLQIMFLAGVQPATHLGNPRQLDAYEYPQDYGPRSPSFARATLTRSEHDIRLCIAGTASIVGHLSRHTGLPMEQTRETVRNLHAVLNQAAHATGVDFTQAQRRAAYKVYVREPASLPDIRLALQDSPLSAHNPVFLKGDLCRRELLMEIEGLIIAESLPS
jgi:chorismate lyase / 3-hydroxybenzoate synthase